MSIRKVIAGAASILFFYFTATTFYGLIQNNTIANIAFYCSGIVEVAFLAWLVYGEREIVEKEITNNNETIVKEIAIVYNGVDHATYNQALAYADGQYERGMQAGIEAYERGFQQAATTYEKQLDRQAATYERQLDRMQKLIETRDENARGWIDYIISILPESNLKGIRESINHPEIEVQFREISEGEWRPYAVRDGQPFAQLTNNEVQLWSLVEHGNLIPGLPAPQ